MSFENLKKQSKLGSLTSKLVKEVEKMSTGESGADDRFWKPEVDKVGNGFATIRFLPAPEGEDLPWSKVWSHAFQGPGGWYIENSLTTLNQKDPVSEHNRGLWNSGNEKDKETVRKQKRKLSYYANIYVVKDPTNPQNEGKVFLYKFGKKIFDKIQEAMKPDFQDEKPVNPFDLWGGSNFRMKIRNVAGYTNFDKSEFDSASALFDGDDKKLEAVWNKLYSLKEFTDPSNFKAYEVLSKKAKDVIGSNIRETSTDDRTVEDEELEQAPRPSAAPKKKADPTPEPEEEMDSMSYFEKLANE